jgi:hypothetical protein
MKAALMWMCGFPKMGVMIEIENFHGMVNKALML